MRVMICQAADAAVPEFQKWVQMKGHIASSVAVLTFALGLARFAQAQSFTFTTIDYPGATQTLATGINNLGQIAGPYQAAGVNNGFVDVGGTLSTLNFPAATSTVLFGNRAPGKIVGGYGPGGSFLETLHGFLDSGGVFTAIDFP